MSKTLLAVIALIIIGGAAAFFVAEEDTTQLAEQNVSVEPGSESVERIPIPPPPETPQEARVTVSNEVEPATAVVAQKSTSRDLLGTHIVSSTVDDPTVSCSSAESGVLRCYGDFLTVKVRDEGIEAAVIDIKQRYNNGDSFVISQCHQLVHVVGRAATLLFPTVAEAYNHGDSFCWSGYYHGIMEAIIADMGIEQVPQRLNEICSALPGKASYSFDYYNCVHGLGHGVMFISEHDLFDSLELCDRLEGGWEKQSCYGGVFMENIIANEVDHISKYLKDDDPLYPCNAVSDDYKHSCYLMQTSRMLDVLGGDFSQVFSYCSQVAEPYTTTCYQSLGRDASGRTASNAERTKSTCLLGLDDRAQQHCVIGAVKDFISYYHSDVEAAGFCDILPTGLQGVCRSTAESYYQSFSS